MRALSWIAAHGRPRSPVVEWASSMTARSNGAIVCPYRRSPPARAASSGPRTFARPVTSSGSSRSTSEAYVANTTTGPRPAHSASWIGLVVVRTPSCSRTSSFSSEHTATIGPWWPTLRHAWAVCTSRSRVGTMTRIRPPRKHSRAAHAAVIVFPEPVAETTVPRSPCAGTGDLVGNPAHARMRAFASTWCSRRLIITQLPPGRRVPGGPAASGSRPVAAGGAASAVCGAGGAHAGPGRGHIRGCST